MGAETPRPAAVARGRLASFGRAIYEFFRRCVLRIISAGPIPQHIAFIMDGNRRYASRRQMNKSSGHHFGYETLMNTLRDCYDLGVKCVSVYAFSIENFGRQEEEVLMLMNLMHEKLEALIDRESMAREYGIRVQVIGDLSLFPERVRNAAERAMAVTEGNDRAVLNICAPYTSTQEIARAVQAVCNEEINSRPELRRLSAVKSMASNLKSEFQGLNGFRRDGAADERQNCDRRESGGLTLASALAADDDGKELKKGRGFKDILSEMEIERRLQESITADNIERHLYTANCPEPELLIRTSGETRLSNFFLWQSSCSYLYFTAALWPEFSFRHLIMAVIEYQRVYPILQQKRRELKRLSAYSY